MAAVNMRHVNFWLPADFRPNYTQRTVLDKHGGSTPATANSRNPAAIHEKARPRPQHSGKPKSAAVMQRHELPTCSEGDSVKAQARGYDSGSHRNRRNGSPSIEKLCKEEISRRNVLGSSQCRNSPSLDTSGSQAQQRLENPASDGQGSHDSPVILDDKLNIPSVENADMLTRAAVNKSTVELKEPADHLGPEARFDIESGPSVVEDCPLLVLGEDGVASAAAAQDQHLSPAPLEDITNRQNNRDAQSALEVLGTDSLPQMLSDGSGQKCANNELERDMKLAFQETEGLSMATPNSSLPRCLSPEPTREQDQSGTRLGQLEEPKDKSPLCTQAEEDKQHGQQRQEEGAVGAKFTVEDDIIVVDTSMPELAEGGGVDTSSEYSDEDDDDEELPSAKRRKKDSRLAHQTSVEIDHHFSPPYQDSSRDSVSLTEYQEWPFQGILKRTRNKPMATYCIEFSLPCISERLNLQTRPKAPSHPKTSTQASLPRTNVAWKPEDEDKLVGMRKGGSSWKEIFAAFPERTSGAIQVRYSMKLKSCRT